MIWDLALIIVGGVIVADLVSSRSTQGTMVIINGITDFWNSSVRGMLGQPTPLTTSEMQSPGPGQGPVVIG